MSDFQNAVNELLKHVDFELHLTPRRDRNLVKEIRESASDLVWTPEETANKGIVLKAGPGKYTPKGGFIPNELKPGQIVFFNEHVGEKDLGQDDLRLIKSSDILAVIEE